MVFGKDRFYPFLGGVGLDYVDVAAVDIADVEGYVGFDVVDGVVEDRVAETDAEAEDTQAESFVEALEAVLAGHVVAALNSVACEETVADAAEIALALVKAVAVAYYFAYCFDDMVMEEVALYFDFVQALEEAWEAHVAAEFQLVMLDVAELVLVALMACFDDRAMELAHCFDFYAALADYKVHC